jgi:hypothetical protein
MSAKTFVSSIDIFIVGAIPLGTGFIYFF